MKLTVREHPDAQETEIIIHCKKIDEDLLKIIASINARNKITHGSRDGETYLIPFSDILYFDSVDKKTFFYTHDAVYESGLRLYEIERQFSDAGFFRASKSTVLNTAKIRTIAPLFGGKLAVTLENGERVLISRQYVPALKRILEL